MNTADCDSTPTVLVVDDDSATTELARVVLERAGFLVRDASNGELALHLYREVPADVVLTDMAMPRMGGLELIESLRREFPQSKIVAMSGGGNILDEALTQGADRVVEKPFSPAYLSRTIADLCEDRLADPSSSS